MLTSCIIPCYNGSKLLRRAVSSLLETKNDDLEIIITDDGSTDDSITIAQQLVAENPHKVRLAYHPNHKNFGVSLTRNLGLIKAQGELICFLDADDFVLPNRFQDALHRLKSDPSVDGIHELAEMRFASDKAEKQWFDGDRRFGFTEEIAPNDLLYSLIWGRCWATSAILFRKALLEKTGNFNVNLHIAEDCNLWMRMATVGRIVQGNINEPVSVYWRTETSAYKPSSHNRLLYVEALLDFYLWAQQKAPPEKKKQIRNEVRKYLIHSVIALRQNDPSTAMQLLAITLRNAPLLLANRTLLRQFSSLLVYRHKAAVPIVEQNP